jgi:hypothetical protein
MSDDVGVEPARLSKLASALEQLRDALATNVPTIVNTMNEYWSAGQGSPISLAMLQQAQSRSVDDATEMENRAVLAEVWLAQKVGLTGKGMVDIPWSGQALNDDTAPARMANALAAAEAEANKDPKAALAEIAAIEMSIQEHLTDGQAGEAWLQAFYNDAGPQVANLATVLHDLNGSADQPITQELQHVFTGQDEQIMKTFATGLANVDSRGLLTSSTVTQLTATPTLWSMGMLIKYGPPGSAYGTQDPKLGSEDFLAQLTQATYTAYQNGTLQIPLGSKYPVYAQAYPQVVQGLEAYDPLSALLQADAQNQTAAQQLLGTPAGSNLASFLLYGGGLRYSYDASGDPPGKDFTILGPDEPPKWPDTVYEGRLSQQAIGNFLDAATAAPRGDGVSAQQAAQAAYNIISQTPAPLIDGGSIVWQVSGPVRQALLDTFGRYMPDLAYSAYGPQRDPIHLDDGAYVLGIGQSQLDNFLQEISADPADYVRMQAMSRLAMGTSIGVLAEGGHIPGLDSPVNEFAALYADVNIQASAVGITEAQQEDMLHQQLNQMLSLAEAGFGVIPGGGEVLAGAKALVAVSTPLVPQFSTDNAANAIAGAQTQQGMAEYTAEIQLVRGLMATGALKDPPPPGSFTASGAPTLQFGNWWGDHSGDVVAGKELSDWLTSIQTTMMAEQNALGQ